MVEVFRKKILFYKRFEVAFSMLAALLVNIYLPILVAVVWLVYINYQGVLISNRYPISNSSTVVGKAAIFVLYYHCPANQ